MSFLLIVLMMQDAIGILRLELEMLLVTNRFLTNPCSLLLFIFLVGNRVIGTIVFYV
jgi:hypothetical protein